MLSINLGPFALSVQHLALLVVAAASMTVARCVSHHQPAARHADSMMFWLLLASLLGARLGFVITYWSHYRTDPLQIIDVRDGGFLTWPGIAAAVIGACLIGRRHAALRRPLAAGLASGLLLWGVVSLASEGFQQAGRLPALVLQNASGAQATLADPRGRPLVVNLWATWCPPCRREMPVLRQAITDYPQVAFVLVNQGERAADVATFLRTVGLDPGQVLFDPQGRLAREVGSRALPTTLFYSAEGRLLGSHLGELSAASLAHELERLTTTP